jgi:hypothetical protein
MTSPCITASSVKANFVSGLEYSVKSLKKGMSLSLNQDDWNKKDITESGR